MIERYVEQVSTYAADIDNVILLIAVLVGFWFFVAEGAFFFLILKFRAKDGVKAEYIDGSNKKHKRWITIPHALVLVCDVFIVIGAVRVWVDVKQTLPPPDATVRVVAQQWAWTFVQPGPDGKLDTPDDITTIDELHIQEGLTYHYELSAVDVLHDFSVPVFRLKQDAIPGRVIKGWFKAKNTGEYGIQCAEMCGIGHGIMGARLHIHDKAGHDKWMASATSAGAAAPAAPPPEEPPTEDGTGGDTDAAAKAASDAGPESDSEGDSEAEAEPEADSEAEPDSESDSEAEAAAPAGGE